MPDFAVFADRADSLGWRAVLVAKPPQRSGWIRIAGGSRMRKAGPSRKPDGLLIVPLSPPFRWLGAVHAAKTDRVWIAPATSVDHGALSSDSSWRARCSSGSCCTGSMRSYTSASCQARGPCTTVLANDFGSTQRCAWAGLTDEFLACAAGGGRRCETVGLNTADDRFSRQDLDGRLARAFHLRHCGTRQAPALDHTVAGDAGSAKPPGQDAGVLGGIRDFVSSSDFP